MRDIGVNYKRSCRYPIPRVALTSTPAVGVDRHLLGGMSIIGNSQASSAINVGGYRLIMGTPCILKLNESSLSQTMGGVLQSSKATG